ncbi:DUF3866 family protein [Aneurinibacillus sp. Ricciae_BoGa-3]|uniref:DUF3866 family protein n=1 Tax=Aneurinibacillus sp. Ricciae_BoGa-3 TaxID=3022697 RepID=UPI002340FAD1|nr:DUF3866 family protein [Aneurinibacillus sp. Ricciae_BoGa-3]WCK55956.1 DUF3866 family protein [Aneurinibacillus sp. Ricciae_BoGa-3]
MLTASLGYVNHIIHNEAHIQITEVIVNGQTAKAINYPVVCGRVSKGDTVLVNTTAVDLSLGTGGYHYVMGRIGEKDRAACDRIAGSHSCSAYEEASSKNPPPASVMKLRYTPAQFACEVEEEQDGPLRNALHNLKGNELEGVPVLVGELHSMLPAACLSIRSITEKPVRICYIMSDGASLPIALSRHVRHLERLGLITGTITYGHAFGGGTECVTFYSALVAAVCIWQADIIIVAPGPGVVGTGTALGFSGMEQVSILQAVHHLKGRPILIPRVSLHEPRDRHYGISHHTSTVLRFLSDIPLHTVLEKNPVLMNQWAERAPSHRHMLTIYPELDENIWTRAASSYPEAITTMGRNYKKDPLFFRHVYYASALACDLLGITGNL